MTKEMKNEELQALHDNVAQLLTEGRQADAKEYLEHHVSLLPEELKNEILGLMFLEAVAEEAEEQQSIESMQKEGLDAMQALKAIQKELEKSARAS